MATKNKIERPFRPRARLLVLLGEQLITSEVIAVVELVKNAYDADATEVNLILENLRDPDKGKITVMDNGTGMNLDTILNVWLEPATDFRKKQREQGKRTPVFRRLPLGEKGVGRFAAHKLGSLVELVTRAEDSRDEVVVKIDWTEFTKGNYLDEIPVTCVIRAPEVFKDKKHGTRIIVENLGKGWSERMVETLFVKLQSINSPFTEKTDFKINLKAPEFTRIIGKLPQLSEVFEKAVYSLKGTVGKNGILHFNYKFYNPAFEHLKREMKDCDHDVRDIKNFKDRRRPSCGSFGVNFYVWDLDRATIGETIKSAFYKNYVKPHTGIRIYKEDFRVWPYGEEKDDSFGLDARRVNNPTLRLSRNQIIGVLEISYLNNPELREKTDREGLILNREYEDFSSLVIGCLSVLEVERRKDKNKVDALREKKKPGDEVHRAIDSMKEKMEKKGHLEIYRKDVRKVESIYDRRIKEVLEPLYVSAGLGIAYSLPVHEITRNIADMERMLDMVIENMRQTGTESGIIEKLEQVLQTTDIVDDLTRGVGKLFRKGKPEFFFLGSVVKDSLDIMKLRLKKDNIQTKIMEKEKIKIKGVKNMLVTALLNLLDNSSYWLLHRQSERKIIIKLDHDNTGRPRIVVSDNGPGIEDDSYLLVEPFFTRKPGGSGLGLYIVDRIIREAHQGEIQFFNQKDGADFLEGANIALIFPEEREVEK